jgi:hypothetical protein
MVGLPGGICALEISQNEAVDGFNCGSRFCKRPVGFADATHDWVSVMRTLERRRICIVTNRIIGDCDAEDGSRRSQSFSMGSVCANK